MGAIPFELKFLSALHLMAHGSYQKPTADNKTFCMSQPMVSRSLHIVLKELLSLSSKYINLPKSTEDIDACKNDFFAKFEMPGIMAAIDGTQIAIANPSSSQNGYLFYNRKHHYSLNVLAVCDAKQRFLYANANYPGSVHDSAIWLMSDLKRRIPPNTFILGDAGFPAETCLLTPYRDAQPGSKEEDYNKQTKKHGIQLSALSEF